MASATVNGAALAVSYVGRGGGSTSPGGSSPDGGQLCLYDDSDGVDHQRHHRQHAHLQHLTKEMSGEEEDDELAAGCDTVTGSETTGQDGGGGGYKRPASSLEPTSPFDPVPVTSLLPSSSIATVQSQVERSSKKRRKQSNPVRLATSARLCNADQDDAIEFGDERSDILEDSPPTPPPPMTPPLRSGNRLIGTGGSIDLEEDMDEGELSPHDDFDGSVYRCPHCNVLFGAEEHLREHVEEEHVQKALERQLQQQNQKHICGTTVSFGNTTTTNSSNNHLTASPFDLSANATAASAVLRLDGRASDSSSSEPSSATDNKPDMDRVSSISVFLQQQHQQQQQHTTSANNPTTVGAPAATLALHSPTDVAGLMALSAFGAAPFLIPVLPCGNTTSVAAAATSSRIPTSIATSAASTGAITGSGSISANSTTPLRIFNPEAFCELCNKEFCNKYFLKTHKANKHGIYSIETLASVVSTAITTPSVTQGTSYTGSKVAVATAATLAGSSVRPLGQSGSPISIGLDSIVGNGNSSGPGIAGNCSTGMTGVLLGSQSVVGKALPVMNPEAFCDICQKEFCNKYFLKKHRQKIHGILDFSISPSFNSVAPPSSSTSSGSMNALVDTAAPTTSMTDQSSTAGSSVTPSSVAVGHHSNPSELFYEYGARDLSAKIAAATQSLLQKHSIQTLVTSSGTNANSAANLSAISTVPASHFTSGTGGPGSGADHAIISGGITVAGHVFSPERLREMGVINVDAFCELCCKEFCNKYFLRTHKMNKHGIGSASGFDPQAAIPGIKSSGPTSAMAHQQSTPLSLVMEKDVCVEDGGRKSTTPNDSSCSSLNGSTNGGGGGGGGGSVSDPSLRPPSVCQDLTQESTSGSLCDPTCDVCSRPFSSAYLLKMHKFYFHNIDQLSMSAVCDNGAATAAGGISTLTTTGVNDGDKMAAPPPSPEGLVPRCDSTNSQKSVTAAGDGNDDIGTSTIVTIGGGSAPPLNEDLQRLQTMIRELNTSPKDGNVKCNICFREMKNKYFLRAHMMNEHGELHSEDDVSLGGGNGGNRDNGTTTNGADRDGGVSDSMLSTSSLITTIPINSNTSSAHKPGSVADPDSFCEMCGKEFCSKYFLRTHKITVHGVGLASDKPSDISSTAPIPLPVGLDAIKVESTTGVPAALSPITSLPLQITPSTATVTISSSLQQATSTIPMITTTERPPMTAITGRNFCEICNKELCNKYFMKTHMLKMHGINVDEKSGINGATIGGVTCDICQKELCSKYFLKVHKQNTHGIYEEPSLAKENYTTVTAVTAVVTAAPTASTHAIISVADKDATGVFHGGDGNASDGGGGNSTGSGNRYFSHYTEVCPLCDRRFKSIKWLKTHVINDHADLAKDSGLADILGAENYLATATTASGGSVGAVDQTFHSMRTSHSHHSLHHHHHHHHHPHPHPLPPPPQSAHHPSLNDHSHPHHHLLLLPRDLAPGSEAPFSIKVEKPSSSSSSTTTSPNATSPFHLHPHQTAQPTPLSSHRPLALLGHVTSENDAMGGGGGSTTATHHAGELGSTGAATAATGVAASASTSGNSSTSSSSPSPASSTSCIPSIGISGSVASSSGFGCVATRKPLGSGNGTRIYHCSYCSYSTRWLSNLYAHEKRHTGLSSEGEKRFCCRVCHRAYRYNHSLQRHLVSHKTTGMLLKHVVSSQALATPGSLHLATSSIVPQQMMTSASLSSQVSPISSQLVTQHTQHQKRSNHEERNDDKDDEEDAEGDESNDATSSRRNETGINEDGGTVGPTSASSQSSKPAPARIKKYRCSKCGAKYRSREQCLEHIHMNHNTRNRHHHIHHYHHHQQQLSLHQHGGHHSRASAEPALNAAGDSVITSATSPTTCPFCPFESSNKDTMANHVTVKHHPQRNGGEDEDEDDDEEDEDREPPGTEGSEESGDLIPADHQLQQQHLDELQHLRGSQQLPMTYAVPQTPPTAGSFIMQPFLISQPEESDGSTAVSGSSGSKSIPSNTFVPSLVYLPVSHKVNETVTVAFTLSPA